MSELEELKARMMVRRERMERADPPDTIDKMLDDLDRAIAIAERMELVRRVDGHVDLMNQLDEARAAVLAGRDKGKRFDEDPHDILGSCRIGSKNWRPCSTCDGMRKWLADTESYEKFR